MMRHGFCFFFFFNPPSMLVLGKASGVSISIQIGYFRRNVWICPPNWDLKPHNSIQIPESLPNSQQFQFQSISLWNMPNKLLCFNPKVSSFSTKISGPKSAGQRSARHHFTGGHVSRKWVGRGKTTAMEHVNVLMICHGTWECNIEDMTEDMICHGMDSHSRFLSNCSSDCEILWTSWRCEPPGKLFHHCCQLSPVLCDRDTASQGQFWDSLRGPFRFGHPFCPRNKSQTGHLEGGAAMTSLIAAVFQATSTWSSDG